MPLHIFGNEVGAFTSDERFALDNNFAFVKTVNVAVGLVNDGNIATGTGTNNAATLQAQINALGPGGSLFIPPGTYRISKITLPSPFTLYGAGNYITILFANNTFNDPTGLVEMNGVGGAPTSIQDMAILGAVGGAGPASSGLKMSTNGCVGRNLWVSAFQTNVYMGNTDNLLLDSFVEVSIGGGIGVRNSQANQTVANCVLYNCGTNAYCDAPFVDGSVVYTGVRSMAATSTAFQTGSAANVLYNGCSAGHNNGGAMVSGAWFLSGGGRITISNPIIRQPGATANAIEASGVTSLVISGGVIEGFVRGVNLTNVDNGVVSGMNILNCTRRGISVQGGDRIDINGNVLHNNGANTGTDAGIYDDNTAQFALHSIVGNSSSNTQAGTNQNYGIFANLTNNGANSGFTNLVGNMTKFNVTGNITAAGLVANISQTGNVV